jgi:hypothetical protein
VGRNCVVQLPVKGSEYSESSMLSCCSLRSYTQLIAGKAEGPAYNKYGSCPVSLSISSTSTLKPVPQSYALHHKMAKGSCLCGKVKYEYSGEPAMKVSQ